MNTQPTTAPTAMSTWRERERIHWARRRQGDDAQDGSGDEGELIPVLAEMHARFARARAKLDALTRREN